MNQETTHSEQNAQPSFEATIESLFRHRALALAHPEDYPQAVTTFGAGGLGAGFSRPVSAATLARCWEVPQFRVACRHCGEDAYIYRFAGHTNAGGYWCMEAYCPRCRRHVYWQHGETTSAPNWSELIGIERSLR